jgi:hypothetical protein
MTIEDFTSDKESAKHRLVSIEPIDPDDVQKWFIDFFEKLSGSRNRRRNAREELLDEFETLEADDINEQLENTLFETISERAENIDGEQLQRNFLRVAINDDTFRLASIDRRLSNLISEIQEETATR